MAEIVAVKLSPGSASATSGDLLAHREARELEFGDAEAHLQPVDLVEMHERRSGGDVGSDRNRAEAERAGERRLDDELIQADLGELYRRAGELELGCRCVKRTLSHIAGLAQLLIALEVGLGEFELRLRVGKLGIQEVGIQLEERCAGCHRIAVLEQDVCDAPARFSGNVDRFLRQQRTDRGHVVAERHLGGNCNLHRQRPAAAGPALRRGLGSAAFLAGMTFSTAVKAISEFSNQ